MNKAITLLLAAWYAAEREHAAGRLTAAKRANYWCGVAAAIGAMAPVRDVLYGAAWAAVRQEAREVMGDVVSGIGRCDCEGE